MCTFFSLGVCFHLMWYHDCVFWLLCRKQPSDHILQNAKNTSKYFKVISAAPQPENGHISGHKSVYQFLTPEENEAVSFLLRKLGFFWALLDCSYGKPAYLFKTYIILKLCIPLTERIYTTVVSRPNSCGCVCIPRKTMFSRRIFFSRFAAWDGLVSHEVPFI